MIEQALSKIVVYWFDPHPQYGPKWVSWSLDTAGNRKKNNPWPAIRRYVPRIVQNEKGRFRTILVVEKATDQIIVQISHQGQWHYSKPITL